MTRFGVTGKCAALQGLALCAALLLALLTEGGIILWIVPNALAALAVAADYVLTPGKKHCQVQRSLPPGFEQGLEAEIALRFTCGVRGTVWVCDSPPDSFRCPRQPHLLTLDEQGQGAYSYKVLPLKRGAFAFGRFYVEMTGVWGLCTKRVALDCPSEAAVYPNLEPMRHYRMLAAKNQLAREDAALHRLRGVGADFTGIREYIPGDDRRKINWKATARAAKLMTNLYDVEKNRDVIVAVDTGRWMCAPMGEVTRLDRALELAAAVMQVAMSSGDRVGLVAFDTEASLYIPPGKGKTHARAFLQGLYGAKPSSRSASLTALSGVLARKLSRRAYVCLLTYIDGPEEAAALAEELAPLKRKHTLFAASLTDAGLDGLVAREAAEPQDIYIKAAAAHRKDQELDAISVLQRYGIGGHAAEPGELLTRSVRHYFAIRAGIQA